jgi:glycosyltransferase involved in cell wall biosynthesis
MHCVHILYIHQYFTTPEEGGGTRSYEFARYLAKKGHKVSMLTGTELNTTLTDARQKKDEYIEGIHIRYLKTPYSNYMPFKKRLYSFIDFSLRATLSGFRIKKYDLIFATSTPLTVAIPGIVLSFFRRVPMVFEVRDLWPEVPIQMGVIKNQIIIKFLRFFEKITCRQAKHIIALSPGMVESILTTGISKDKVTMIPNYCNLDFFKPGKPKVNNLRKLVYNNHIIAYSGAISDANNLELIIDAAEKLQKVGSPVIFVIAGDGKEKPKLEKFVETKKLKNIIFLGRISKHEVVNLYRRAIACIILFKNLPVLSTNSPNKFFDAISTGKPIITNMGGWIGEMVESNKIGFSVENDNPQAIVKAVLQLINMDKKQLEEMEKNARKLAVENFDSNVMAGKLEMIFERAIKGERSI